MFTTDGLSRAKVSTSHHGAQVTLGKLQLGLAWRLHGADRAPVFDSLGQSQGDFTS